MTDYISEEQVNKLLKQVEDLTGVLGELLVASVKECVVDGVFDKLDHLSGEGIISVTPSIQILACAVKHVSSALSNLHNLHKQIRHKNE